MQEIFFVWIIVAMTLFALAVTLTPSESMDNTAVFWLAILVLVWPLIAVVSILGIVAAYVGNFFRGQ